MDAWLRTLEDHPELVLPFYTPAISVPSSFNAFRPPGRAGKHPVAFMLRMIHRKALQLKRLLDFERVDVEACSADTVKISPVCRFVECNSPGDVVRIAVAGHGNSIENRGSGIWPLE